jgi:hypothetical protein
MFALLQMYPLEALPLAGEPDDDCGGVDVLAIDASRERLEQFAADYEQRYRAAQAMGGVGRSRSRMGRGARPQARRTRAQAPRLLADNRRDALADRRGLERRAMKWCGAAGARAMTGFEHVV